MLFPDGKGQIHAGRVHDRSSEVSEYPEHVMGSQFVEPWGQVSLRSRFFLTQKMSNIPGWWFGTFGLFFHSVGNVIIPTDELHHFSEGLKPPTSYICIKHQLDYLL